ncbi:MAG TPA: hypothetical protein VMT73_03735, partial [Anaerolineales bacterium]|nr:hypothetical protein [Anaerolineales bacterium]
MSRRNLYLNRTLSLAVAMTLILTLQPSPAEAHGSFIPSQTHVQSGSLSMPAPTNSWDGISNVYNLDSVIPPDVNGDVGPDHYVQVVNNLYSIWNKVGVNLFPYGPHQITEPFTGYGGLCESDPGNGGMVLYDHMADRWVLTYPAYGVGQYLQCVAVSKTPDPVNGGWYQYSFLISTNKVNDHPKLAIWPDGYYIVFNELDPATQAFKGEGIAAFERQKMLQGQSAEYYSVDLKQSFPTSNLHDMLFADLDGTPPAAGTPAYLAQVNDGSTGNDQLEVWQVVSNFGTGAPAQIGQTKFISVPDFSSSFCSGAVCIPQPGTTQKLNPISAGLMNRLQYRYQGGESYLVVDQTVNVGSNQAGIRWYQLESGDFNNWSLADSGTYAPDSNNRWNGSAAMDASGNIA